MALLADAHSSEATTTAAAPSLTPGALPAVCVASSPPIAGSFAEGAWRDPWSNASPDAAKRELAVREIKLTVDPQSCLWDPDGCSNVAPELTLTYRPTDTLTAYGSLKKGYKSGSFNITTLTAPGVDNSFGDEEVEGGEIGLKTRLLDRRLALDVAAYDYKYKGLQVAPAELEALLLTHPAILDAAVVRRPDEEAGEVPKAFVVLRPDEASRASSAAAIMAWVAERVAPHKRIRHLEFIDQIPKSASGKILRRVLMDRDR